MKRNGLHRMTADEADRIAARVELALGHGAASWDTVPARDIARAFADEMDSAVRRGGLHYLQCFAWAAITVYFSISAIGAAFGGCA